MSGFRSRLSPWQRRQYDRGNRVGAIPLKVSSRLHRAIEVLPQSLATGDQRRTEALSQIICDEVCAALRVSSPRVRVEGVRRSDRSGELHGLFSSAPAGDRIQVWMYTAKRRQVVAFKTFLRTLVHEICHHLDYALLRLGESFHNEGFFKRESSLVRQMIEASRTGGMLRLTASTGAVPVVRRRPAWATGSTGRTQGGIAAGRPKE
jgi:hypothetical protein